MDQWATDKFYSHFPSYSGERSKRELLDKDRQNEYNQYLSRLASADTSARNFATDKNIHHEREAQQPTMGNSNAVGERDASLRTENMDIPDIFNEEIIKRRNRRVAEERLYRNLKYQRELLEQIEQKRKEAAERKAKEIEADEQLTRKVEAQLRSVRLQDEMERAALAGKQRNYESKLATSPPKRNTSNRSVNQSPHRSRYTGRLTERDYGKENMAAASKVANDADTYKYFSNSVRDPMDWRHMDVRSQSGHGVDVNVTMESHRCENHTFPMKKNRDTDARNCARCDSDVYREMCNFCEQNRLLARSQYENYALHDDRRHPNLCKSCFYKSICACCREEICIRCNRPTKISNSPVKAKVESVGKQSPRRRKPSPRTRRMNLSLLEENYDDSSDDGDGLNYSERPSSRMSSPKKYQSVAKPYSFNISESSMFHPMNTSTGTHDATQKGIAKGSHDDLKRMTDEKLSRYAKNYGDMRTRNAPLSKLIDIDPHPMPLMAQENTRSRSFNAYSASDSADSSVGNGFALKQMEARWQIPFVRTNTAISDEKDERICVLTQSGAFKKQLQMGKYKSN